jgi:DNA-binding CsgD family transcriptional regulator
VLERYRSRRETQLTSLLLRGLQNREIATMLGISPNTVRNMLHAIFKKADVSTRSELVFVVSNPESAVALRPGRSSLALRDFMKRVETASSGRRS